MSFEEVKNSIDGIDREAVREVENGFDRLVKPRDSLGQLEDICARVAGIQGSEPRVDGSKIFVLAGDHGVTEEGVSAYPSAVTGKMMEVFGDGGAAINVLSDRTGSDVEFVDMGADAEIEADHVVDRKIDHGTYNFRERHAMEEGQAERSVSTGIELVEEFAADADVIGLGEIGIGNTSSSAAIFCAMSDLEPGDVVGRGSGLDEEGVGKKVEVVRESLEKHGGADDPLEALRKYGGFEIGGLTGVILGAAARGKAVVVDGYITLAAALLATEIAPEARDYLLFSHVSGENGFEEIADEIGAEPMLDLEMKLGEGTGAALAIEIVRNAIGTYHGMHTFEDAGIE